MGKIIAPFVERPTWKDRMWTCSQSFVLGSATTRHHEVALPPLRRTRPGEEDQQEANNQARQTESIVASREGRGDNSAALVVHLEIRRGSSLDELVLRAFGCTIQWAKCLGGNFLRADSSSESARCEPNSVGYPVVAFTLAFINPRRVAETNKPRRTNRVE